jgi:hypothetical protein
MTIAKPIAEDSYSPRERRFVIGSALLGYVFDFYDLIIMAFLLTQIQHSLNMTLPQTGLIVAMTLTASVVGGVAIGWLGDKIGRKKSTAGEFGAACRQVDPLGPRVGFHLTPHLPHLHRDRRRR